MPREQLGELPILQLVADYNERLIAIGVEVNNEWTERPQLRLSRIIFERQTQLDKRNQSPDYIVILIIVMSFQCRAEPVVAGTGEIFELKCCGAFSQ